MMTTVDETRVMEQSQDIETPGSEGVKETPKKEKTCPVTGRNFVLFAGMCVVVAVAGFVLAQTFWAPSPAGGQLAHLLFREKALGSLSFGPASFSCMTLLGIGASATALLGQFSTGVFSVYGLVAIGVGLVAIVSLLCYLKKRAGRQETSQPSQPPAPLPKDQGNDVVQSPPASSGGQGSGVQPPAPGRGPVVPGNGGIQGSGPRGPAPVVMRGGPAPGPRGSAPGVIQGVPASGPRGSAPGVTHGVPAPGPRGSAPGVTQGVPAPGPRGSAPGGIQGVPAYGPRGPVSGPRGPVSGPRGPVSGPRGPASGVMQGAARAQSPVPPGTLSLGPVTGGVRGSAPRGPAPRGPAPGIPGLTPGAGGVWSQNTPPREDIPASENQASGPPPGFSGPPPGFSGPPPGFSGPPLGFSLGGPENEMKFSEVGDMQSPVIGGQADGQPPAWDSENGMEYPVTTNSESISELPDLLKTQVGQDVDHRSWASVVENTEVENAEVESTENLAETQDPAQASVNE